MPWVSKKIGNATIIRVLNGLMELMEKEEKEVFCKAISHTAEGLQAQIGEYEKKNWWGGCKKERMHCEI